VFRLSILILTSYGVFSDIPTLLKNIVTSSELSKLRLNSS